MSGVVTGLLIALVAAWIWHGYGRLWRRSLAEDAASAMDAAADLGMRVWPARHRTAWLAEGTLDGVRVRITWAGGVRGERTLLDIGGLRRTLPLVCGQEALRSALSGREE